MPLLYYPREGEIVFCDYGRGFVAPEMVKGRPVIIVSPRLRRRGGLVAVVPLSTTPPDPAENYHCLIALAKPLPHPFDSPTMWAKCDMLATVSTDRLDRFKDARNRHGGARTWRTEMVTAEELASVKRAMLCGLGLSSLTVHL